MSNILIYTAVPFSLGRLQSVGRVALRSCADAPNMQTDLRCDGQTRGKKRMRLTHFTQEEKYLRRKMMCREASQKARDAVNIKMNLLEKKLHQLKRERNTLLMENKTLKETHEQLSNENEKLLQTAYLGCSLESSGNTSEEMSPQKMLNADECNSSVPSSLDINEDWRSLGHALFINTPLLKGQDLQQFFRLMIMMAITGLLSASVPHISTEVLIRDLVLPNHPFISNIVSGTIHTMMNSICLALNYCKSWT